MNPTPSFTQPEPQRSGLMTALVAGALIVLVAANVYLYMQIDHLRTDLAKQREALMTEVSNLRDASSVTSQSQARHLETLKRNSPPPRRRLALFPDRRRPNPSPIPNRSRSSLSRRAPKSSSRSVPKSQTSNRPPTPPTPRLPKSPRMSAA